VGQLIRRVALGGGSASRLLTLFSGRAIPAPAWVTHDLWASWLLDEGTGDTAADSSGNGRDLTLENGWGAGDTWDPEWVAEGLSWAKQSGGLCRQFTWTNAAPNVSAGYTFEVAFLATTGAPYARTGLLNVAPTYSPVDDISGDLFLHYFNYGTPVIGWVLVHNQSGTPDEIHWAWTYDTAAWHLLQLTYTPPVAPATQGTAELYIDGTSLGAQLIDVPDLTGCVNTMLGNGWPRVGWWGRLAAGRIFTVALSVAELAAEEVMFASLLEGRGVASPFPE